MSRVVVTGGNGYVGSQIVAALAEQGVPVRGLGRADGDVLSESGRAAIAALAPEIVIHSAWVTEHGHYWHAPENDAWADASLQLFQALRAAGTRRIIGIGTVAEYDWTGAGRVSEATTPITPATRYGQAKAAAAASLDGDHAWARLFFSFGAHEDHRRLVPSVLTAALKGEAAKLGPGTDLRCFLDVRDVGRAVAALAVSGVQGPVNIGRGEAMAIKDLAAGAVAAAGQGSLAVGVLPARPGDPPELVAVVDRLAREVGFTPTIALPQALSDAADWWRRPR